MRKEFCLFCVVALSACGGSGVGSRTPEIPSTTTATTNSSTDQSVIGPLSTDATAAGAAVTTWNIGTGASTDNFALQDLDFYPKTITIDAGDRITWHIASGAGGDAHTIAFLAPGQTPPPENSAQAATPAGGSTYDGTTFVNSGALVGGQTYTLRFTKAGTFRMYCLFHEPAMEGTVTVQKAGTPYPHNAQYYVHVSEVDEWEDLGAAQTSIASFPFKVGGTTLAAGIDPGLTALPPPDSTVLRFLNTNNRNKLDTSGNLTIKVGGKITWVNETANEPHTVTFPPAGQPPPNIDPNIPVGGTVYNGTKLVHSGEIKRGCRFTVTFTKPGVFKYYCLFHDNSGMVGTITVTK